MISSGKSVNHILVKFKILVLWCRPFGYTLRT